MQIWYRLGRVGNVALNLHYSWLLAITLGLWTLIHSWIPARVPDAGGLGLVLLALLIVFLALASVLAHALVQIYAAQALTKAKPPGVINLGVFGIAAPVLEGSTVGRQTALATLAGPIFSGLLALLFNLLATALSGNLAVSAIFAALALVNAFLAIFNLIPAVPLDGAAILRALVPAAATFTEALTTLLAIVLVAAGAWVGFANLDIDLALWLIFLGWTVRELAASVGRRQALRGTLRSVAAAEIMQREYPTVQADETLANIMAQRELRGTPQVPVLDGTALVGILPIDLVEESLQGTWAATTARDVMLARQAITTAQLDASVLEAVDLLPNAGGDLSGGTMGADGKRRQLILPVIAGQELRGVLTSERLAGFASVQQTFGMSDSPVLADPPSGRLLGLSLLGLLIIAFVAAGSVRSGTQGRAIDNEALLPSPTALPAVPAAAVRYLWPNQLAADLKLDPSASTGAPASLVQSGGDWDYSLTYRDSNRSFRLIGGKNVTVPSVGGKVEQLFVHNNPARLNRNTNRISLRWGEGGGTVAITSLGVTEQEVLSIAEGTISLTPLEWNNRLRGEAPTPELPPAQLPTAVSLPQPTLVPTVAPAAVRYMFPEVVAADVKLIKEASYADPLSDTNTAATHWSYKSVYHDSSRSFTLWGGAELSLATVGGTVSEVTVHGNPARLAVNGNRISLQWGEGGGVVTLTAQGMDQTEVISIAEGSKPLTPSDFAARLQPLAG